MAGMFSGRALPSSRNTGDKSWYYPAKASGDNPFSVIELRGGCPPPVNGEEGGGGGLQIDRFSCINNHNSAKQCNINVGSN